MFQAIVIAILLFSAQVQANTVSELAASTAQYAVKAYQDKTVASLTELVKYNTEAVKGVKSPDNKIHIAFKKELARQAKLLGLDYQDHGYIVIIGLGDSEQRLGLITHGDVKPANASIWEKSPYELDMTSEPGKLIGRGTEDDKGAISAALYAMKAIKDKNIPLKKRIELYIYMAEETDWQPLIQYTKSHELPQLNITLDSQYPVAIAEKGYGTLAMTFANQPINNRKIYIREFSGGFFGGQIPEDAKAVIVNADEKLLASIKAKVAQHQGAIYQYYWQNSTLTVIAKGKSAHSSEPEHGINAITHLADALSFRQWPANDSGSLVNFVNEYVGLNLFGENFGNIAYRDDFMGPMTVSATHIIKQTKGLRLSFNIRRPVGKTSQQLVTEIEQALEFWQIKNDTVLFDIKHKIRSPWVQKQTPHLDTLLSIFKHYTSHKQAKAVSFAGGTNSRYFPNAVSFGPSMPGAMYTGHTEYEFITVKQLKLNLQMYTAALVELSM